MSFLMLGQQLGQQTSQQLSLFFEKEGNMASIYPNKKEGKIVSFKFKAYLGRDEEGKQIFKCKTWIPEKSMSENKLIALAEKEVMIWESLFIKELSENKRQITPTAITLGTFIEEVWIPYQKACWVGDHLLH